MQEWLKAQGIPFDSKLTKKQLYALCQAHKQPAKYEIDKLLLGTPHELLRLPPYHLFYNAIELVWGITKRYYDKHVGRDNDFSEESTFKIWDEALAQVTPEIWSDCVAHVEKRILEDYEKEIGQEFQVFLNNEDDDDSDETWEDVSELDSNSDQEMTLLNYEEEDVINNNDVIIENDLDNNFNGIELSIDKIQCDKVLSSATSEREQEVRRSLLTTLDSLDNVRI